MRTKFYFSLFFGFFLFLSVVRAQEPGPATTHNDTEIQLGDLMRQAAYGQPVTRAMEKRRQATKNQQLAVILDQFSVSGGLTKNFESSDSSLTYNGIELDASQGGGGFNVGKSDDKIYNGSLRSSLTLSAVNWLQSSGLKIIGNLQEVGLEMTRMQLASEAARYYLEFYVQSSRLFTLNYTIQSLSNDEVHLTAANRQLLQSYLTEVKASVNAVEFQVNLAKNQLKKIVGFMPSTPEFNQGEHPDFDLDKRWEQVNKAFPIPDSVTDGLKLLNKSPSILQAALLEKQAINQWYTTIAGSAPYLILSAGYNDSQFHHKNENHDKLEQESNGTSLSIGVQISINGGLYHHLRAGNDEIGATRFDSEQTKLNLETSLRDFYDSKNYAFVETNRFWKDLIQLIETMNGLDHITDGNINTMIGLLRSLDLAGTQANDNFKGYVLARIQIQALLGTLLENINTNENLKHKDDDST